jgi:thiosulfate reductase cytochrome b subunit
MATIRPKHPLAIRWFHWINFPVLLIMIWSGTLILWANDVYPTQIYQAGYKLLHGGKENETPPVWLKVPNEIVVSPVFKVVYKNADLEGLPEEDKRTSIRTGYRLADGMNWHFTLAWLFSLNGLAYVLYLLFSKEYKLIFPKKDSFIGAFKVVLHDLKIYKKPLPEQKFNHAQRIAYTSVIVLGFLMIVTGLAIYKPAQLGWLAALLGGYQAARLEHFIITCLFVMFFFVHIFQVMRAGWNNFRAMITGWEILPEKGEDVTSVVREGVLESSEPGLKSTVTHEA